MDSIIQSIAEALNGLPKELVVLIISMFPILELRGGLIAAALLGLPIERGILFALIGNIIPIPFILLLITPIFDRLKKTKKLHAITNCCDDVKVLPKGIKTAPTITNAIINSATNIANFNSFLLVI